MDKPIVKQADPKETRGMSRAIATPAQIRRAGLILQDAILAYNTSIAAAASAIEAINTAVAAFDFKGIDGALPTQANLKAQIVAFNALPTSLMSKPTLTVAGDFAAVNS